VLIPFLGYVVPERRLELGLKKKGACGTRLPLNAMVGFPNSTLGTVSETKYFLCGNPGVL